MAESSGDSTTSGAPAPRAASEPGVKRKRLYHHLYFWVLLAIVAGAVVGVVAPDFAVALKPLADGFVKLIRMLIAPIIFTTVVVGIASLGNLTQAGRLGVKALGYFLTMTLIALAIGLVVINLINPGAGLNVTPDPADAKETLGSLQETPSGVVPFLLHIIPDTFVGAFTEGEIIQVLFIAILSGIALTALGDLGAGIVAGIDAIGKMIFRIVHIVLYAAPIGAFGGMAYTVGRFDIGVLGNLATLMVAFYATCLLFILVILGGVAAVFGGFNILKFIRLIKDELLIVLGTSSSESVLPRIMAKLENAGADRSVVGLTIPTGYSFNLDGTCIYLTMGAIFIAEATNTPMSIGQQIGLLLLLVSKGAAGVTGAGLVTLAAGLQAFGHVPAVGIALIVGIDRFMSEARAITNLIGNAVATMVIARWEPGGRNDERFREVLDDPSLIEDIDVPEEYETPQEYEESHRPPALTH